MDERTWDWPTVNSVGDIIVKSGFVLETRSIPDYELVYFPEGSATLYEPEGELIRLDVPSIVFTRPGEIHRYRFDPGNNVRHLFVHFDYPLLRREESRLAEMLKRQHVMPVANLLVPAMIKQMLQIASRKSPTWKRRLSVLLAAVLEELAANVDNADPNESIPMPIPIERAIAYIQAHLSESLTIESIAKQSGWSHEHFTRMFVAHLGVTPKRFLLERRLLHAEQLMMAGSLTIKQIAYQVGFSDEHHFSKMYKAIRGITASDYVNRCKDPLFRNTAAAAGTEASYPVNFHTIVNPPIN